MKMNFNVFILACAILQACGSINYYFKGDKILSILYLLYGMTNFTILFLKG